MLERILTCSTWLFVARVVAKLWRGLDHWQGRCKSHSNPVSMKCSNCLHPNGQQIARFGEDDSVQTDWIACCFPAFCLPHWNLRHSGEGSQSPTHHGHLWWRRFWQKKSLRKTWVWTRKHAREYFLFQKNKKVGFLRGRAKRKIWIVFETWYQTLERKKDRKKY